MSNLPTRLAALSSAQRALFEYWLLERNQAVKPKLQIQPRNTADPSPLSFAQQRLWFIHQLHPTSPVYNMPKLFRLKGKLNQHALQSALDMIVQRHEVLRTIFPKLSSPGADLPVQVICPPQPVPIKRQDLQGHAGADRETRARELVRQAIYQPFDLTTDLMLRAFLLQLAADDQILLLVIHHSATDGWSMRVLAQEFAQLYTAVCTNQPVTLPALAIQYADYSVWQRQWLTGERLATRLAYWQQQFATTPPLLDLPVDRPRALHQTDHGAHEIYLLPPALTVATRAFCLRENVTLFMTLLAAFQTLLHRYTGQTDIVIGTPIANRTPLETERLIGFFVNTLALRGDLTGDPTVRELLDRVRQVALGAYDHSELPFEKLLEELPIARDPSHHALFQVMFALQNLPDITLTLPDLTLEPFAIDKGTAPFDLYMNITDSKGELKVALYYRTDLFDQATVRRMLGHFDTLLTAMVAAQPGGAALRLSQLPILTAAERRQLLTDWNATQQPVEAAVCVHHLFEAHCHRHPQQTALIYRETALTYQALNVHANQLAHHLQNRGVAPAGQGTPLVAICLQRTPEATVALLAVLKAGGAFLCLDPAWPAERLATVLQQAGVAWLITSSDAAENLPAPAQRTSIYLDREAEQIRQAPTTNPAVAIDPADLAYVVTTSGSTGIPKCIMVPQRAISNYAAFSAQTFAICHTDRRLQFSSFGSEHFIADMLVYLAYGAALVFRPAEEALVLGDFLAFLETQQISIASLPSAYWQQWALALAEEPLPIPSRLRLVITGMDVVKPAPFALWQTKIGKRLRWINLYGPAETTCASSWYEADFASTEPLARIPIGRPIPNTQIYLLDPALQPVPIGVTGEIYIGGAGVAHGYCNQPTQTAEKFIANPYGAGTLYKTGDLARYLPDGQLDFLGRQDHQVKIRGFRIELQEIEQQLMAHPTVTAAVVVAHRDQAAEQLVAYLVPAPGALINGPQLRHYLKQQLPNYMIPQNFVLIETMPMTANGKINRLALPVPDFNRMAVTACFVTPRNAVETQIATIWCELLQVRAIGVHDDFFEWGGHSLLATRIVSHVNQRFGVEFPLRALFDRPTIAEMALLITRLQAQQLDPSTLEAIISDLEGLTEEITVTALPT